MNENSVAIITALIAAFSAFVASIISIIVSYFREKRRLKAEIISLNRINWMNNVRKLLTEFFTEYMHYSPEISEKKQNLILIRNKISLYLRKGYKSYDDLVDALNNCINAEYSDALLDKVIIASQIVLSEVWFRAKGESGISIKEDNKYQAMFSKE